MYCAARVPSTARIRILASRTRCFATGLPTHFAESGVVVDQVFWVKPPGFKQGLQTLRGVLKSLQVCFAHGPMRRDVIANGKAMVGNGEWSIPAHVLG